MTSPSKASAAVDLDPQLRAALASIAKRPARRYGNPWGPSAAAATQLLDLGLIEAATAHDGSRTWEVWRATAAGRKVLADGEAE